MEEEEKTERERGKGTSKRHIQQNQVRSGQIKYYLVSDYLLEETVPSSHSAYGRDLVTLVIPTGEV